MHSAKHLVLKNPAQDYYINITAIQFRIPPQPEIIFRHLVPLGHDGGGVPELPAVPVLPALDARRPPTLSPPRQGPRRQ